MPGKPERLMGEDTTAGKVMETVLLDTPYYNRSGGGLTLSGGECLAQPDFSEALLSLAHRAGINTCIETTGYADDSVLKRVIPLVDHVLLDIKHTDSEKHRAFTGKPNDVILENAKRISALTPDLTVRIPVVPGFNDTAEEIRAIAMFARTLPRVSGIHLLPYHRLGQDKYTALGRDYTLSDILPPTKEKMEYLLGVAQESGFYCRIGG